METTAEKRNQTRQRQKKLVAARKAAGLVRMSMWVTLEQQQLINEYLETLKIKE